MTLRCTPALILFTAAITVNAPVSALEEDWYELISPLLPEWVGSALSLAPSVAPDHEAISADIPGQSNPDKEAITDVNYADQASGGFNTGELIARTVAGFPDCVDYCIDGIVLGFRNFSTLSAVRWHHRNADFIVQTYPSQRANTVIPAIPGFDELQAQYTAPWNEWALLVGEATHGITESFVEDWLPPAFAEFGLDGGQLRSSQYGHQQSHNFKEVDVIGHPYVLIPLLLDRGGEIGETEECDLDEGTCSSTLPGVLGETADQEVADEAPDPETGEAPAWYEMTPQELAEAGADRAITEIDNYAQRLIDCAYDLRCVVTELLDSAEFRQLFSMVDAIAQYRTLINQFNNFAQIIQDISTVIGSGALTFSPRLDRFLCPSLDDNSYIRPFLPYYLSAVDPAWRNGLIDFDIANFGFPNDIHRWSTILNPFSEDRIGEHGELWGYMYPRSGIHDHPHDAKGGMVMIKRAVDIIEEDWEDPSAIRKRLRWNQVGFPPVLDDDDEPMNGRYQMLYPFEQNQCAAEPWILDRDDNVHGDFMYPGQEQRYAYNYWRKSTCLSTNPGTVLARIDLPDICL